MIPIQLALYLLTVYMAVRAASALINGRSTECTVRLIVAYLLLICLLNTPNPF
jgi:hypothetical protein